MVWLAPLWLVLTCVLFAQTTHAQVSQPRETSRADTAEAARRIIVLTNAFRQQESLTVVGPAPQLASAARYFADFMARTGKYGHSADGSEPATRARRLGYEHCIIAENIARVFSSEGFAATELANRLFNDWQNSPEHRKNMLDPNVTETAVAVAHSAETGSYYAVQLFGRPKSQLIEFSVANRAGTAVEYSLDGHTFPLPPRATSTHRTCKRAELKFRGKTLRPVNGQQLSIVNLHNGMRLQAQ